MAPLRAGITPAITVALFYTLCTLVWLLAPRPFLGLIRINTVAPAGGV